MSEGLSLSPVEMSTSNDQVIDSFFPKTLIDLSNSEFSDSGDHSSFEQERSSTYEETHANNEHLSSSENRIHVNYPPDDETNTIVLCAADTKTLFKGKFINDKIIDFYLRYLYLEVLSTYDRNRSFIFNSYFYGCLCNSSKIKVLKSSQKLTPELRHESVKRWTKKENIFDKDFIVIPINEHQHWFLAIICFPRLAIKAEIPEAISAECLQSALTNKETYEKNDNINQEYISPVEKTAVQDVIPQTCPPGQQMPLIMIFDSLRNRKHKRIGTTLKEYLECEYNAKNMSTRRFDASSIMCSSVELPRQSNSTDCGIYLLQYVESFFKDPFPYMTHPLPDMSDWFTEDIILEKRDQIKAIILGFSQTK